MFVFHSDLYTIERHIVRQVDGRSQGHGQGQRHKEGVRGHHESEGGETEEHHSHCREERQSVAWRWPSQAVYTAASLRLGW